MSLRALPNISLIILIAANLFLACPLPATAQGTKEDYERAFSLGKSRAHLVDRAEVKPHWLPDNLHFWYRVQTGENASEFVFVDASAGTRAPAFDHARLAAALASATGKTNRADNLPLFNLDFSTSKTLRFTSNGRSWLCNLEDYSIMPDRSAASATTAHTLSTLHPSLRDGEACTINFTNRTTNEVRIFWIDSFGDRKSYGTIAPGTEFAQNTYAGHVWLITTTNDQTLGIFEAGPEGGEVAIEGNLASITNAPPDTPADSPDGKWTAFLRDHNILLREKKTGIEHPLSSDGAETNGYEDDFHWSPDSQKLAALQKTKGEEHKVYLIESSPKDQLQPKLLSYDYNKPGDRMPIERPRLFDIASRRQVPVSDALFTNAWSIEEMRWWPDSSRFTFLYNRRGHQSLKIISVAPQTGEASAIVDEESPTFIDYAYKKYSHYLDATHEIIWMSERDGWNHLYLYDAGSGHVKNQITHGKWIVRSVDHVDEAARQIWFRAGGVRPGQDPYYIHYCRVNFDGTGLVVLTEGDATHEVEFSPDRRFFVDTWSRVDQPPVTELRSGDDGHLICNLEHADISRLQKTGWRAPERFSAKGRDGQTDIYGVIFRPMKFNPSRKYPVIENIYAGPQGSFTPKAFRPFYQQEELAELGFIVAQMDGMGTSDRSKKFHDVCWKNLADAGFPDRILWLKAAAARYPEMDMARLGIYGGSAGGQDAMRALLDHGDFYKVAVADCGCHDNRMDKIWWNELWMGWPVDASYERSSNVADAHKLQGKLLLMVGELDHNVDPASTMQVVNALEKANKDFDLIVMTGSDHGSAESPYGRRRRADFLVRNLLGLEPRN